MPEKIIDKKSGAVLFVQTAQEKEVSNLKKDNKQLWNRLEELEKALGLKKTDK